MGYQLPADVESAIQKQLETGDYSTPEEVLRDALRALDERRCVILEEDPLVVDGIRRGLADMKAGRSTLLEDFDRQFRAKHGISDDA